jgi:hypothetical protein
MSPDAEALVDRRILSCAAHQWQKTAMLVGKVLRLRSDADVDEDFIAARIEVLVEDRRLASRGDPSDPRQSEIRLSA